MYPGRIPGRVRIGMGAPLATYDDRLAETGPVFAQRIFCNPISDDNTPAADAAVQAGRLPVVSFKVAPYTWAQAASGAADAAVDKALTALQAIDGPVVVVFHHEPASDGLAADFAAMQARLLPRARRKGLATAVIFDGWWWGKGGLTDAQINAYLPDSVLPNVDAVAFDVYESDRNPSVAALIDACTAWADRRGITELGIGEFGCRTGDGIRDVGRTLLGHADRFGWACYFNSPRNSREDWTLTADRLTAFREILAASVPPPPPAPVDPRDAQIADLTAKNADLTAQVAMLQRAVTLAQADATAADSRAAAAAAQLTTTLASAKDSLLQLAATL